MLVKPFDVSENVPSQTPATNDMSVLEALREDAASIYLHCHFK